MSLLAICGLAVCAVCLLRLGWAALKPLPEEMPARRGERIEDLLAQHARHFPQLRQALATLDADYVRQKASGEIERHVHADRQHVVEGFLSGLGEDFGRLERMSRMVQEMSPAESWIHQFQRAGSRFRFRASYRLASLRIGSARLESTDRLTRLTELLGNLSAQIEANMALLAAPSGDSAPQAAREPTTDLD
jgi:hypothetical protein